MLAGAGVLIAVTLAMSACGGSHLASTSSVTGSSTPVERPPGMRISATKVSSSHLILGGRARCTATVSRSVQAGSPLGLTFAVHNLSKHTVRVFLAEGGLWMVVKAADGTTYRHESPAPQRDRRGCDSGLDPARRHDNRSLRREVPECALARAARRHTRLRRDGATGRHRWRSRRQGLRRDDRDGCRGCGSRLESIFSITVAPERAGSR